METEGSHLFVSDYQTLQFPFDRDLFLVIIGFLKATETITIDVIERLITEDEVIIRECIEILIDSQIIEVELEGNEISLLYCYPNEDIILEEINPEEIKLLALFKSIKRIELRNLSKISDMTSQSIFRLLGRMAYYELIGTISFSEGHFSVTFTKKYENCCKISEVHKLIIGSVSLGVINLEGISSALNLPREIILQESSKIILANLANLSISPNFQVDDIIFSIDQSPVKSGDVLDIQFLSEIKRQIMGYFALTGKSNLQELTDLFRINQTNLVKTLAEINYEVFPIFRLYDNSTVIQTKKIDLMSNVSMEELVLNSIFNYTALIGILTNSKRSKLKSVARKMRSNENEIKRRIINLFLANQINGRFLSGDTFELVQKSSPLKMDQNYQMLSPQEKTLLGLLISRKKVNWPDIGVLMNLDREESIELAYTVLAKFSSYVTISQGRTLVLLDTLNIPPLEQINQMDLQNQIITGFAVLKSKARLSKLTKLLNLQRRELLRRIYFLIGSGIIIGYVSRRHLEVKRVRIDQPFEAHHRLPNSLFTLVNYLLESPENKIKLKELQKVANQPKQDVIKNLAQLTANGYIFGTMNRNTFHRTTMVLPPKDAPHCINCGTILKESSTICGECNLTAPNCLICKGKLSSSDRILQCPFCSSYAHKLHMIEWLSIVDSCPLCKSGLKAEELIKPEFNSN